MTWLLVTMHYQYLFGIHWLGGYWQSYTVQSFISKEACEQVKVTILNSPDYDKDVIFYCKENNK